MNLIIKEFRRFFILLELTGIVRRKKKAISLYRRLRAGKIYKNKTWDLYSREFLKGLIYATTGILLSDLDVINIDEVALISKNTSLAKIGSTACLCNEIIMKGGAKYGWK